MFFHVLPYLPTLKKALSIYLYNFTDNFEFFFYIAIL